MKNKLLLVLIASFFLIFTACDDGDRAERKQMANKILEDTLMNKVELMAREVIKGGFNAGAGYGEVWIRDFNTFIELAMDVLPNESIEENLLTFFHFQGKTGDIIDGFIDINRIDLKSEYGSKFRVSKTEPRYAAHKNTVETDQESSLIQAVWKYVKKTGHKDFLQKVVDGKTVEERLEWSMDYLLNERFSEKYGLLWGATTVDWGDVQPEHPLGVLLDENSHLSVDIYDNALFLSAINNFIDLTSNSSKIKKWTLIRNQIKENIRKYLWDVKHQKFIPHLYLTDSPFPADFDENALLYHGGTAVAIEADLLTKDEIAISNAKMMENVKESGAATIGITVYPPYPEGFFKNKGLSPYGYQNGGDWTWFGARMIQQLIRNGFVKEAYEEATPMFERVVKNKGFYEWYSRNNEPRGSATFRGEAGVLYSAIKAFKKWAQENK